VNQSDPEDSLGGTKERGVTSKTCPSCQTEGSESATFCPQCGATLQSTPAAQTFPTPQPVATQNPTPYPQPVQMGSGVPTFKFDANRWSKADRISGIASAVLFISLFLPWFGIGGLGVSITENALSSHGFLYLVLFITLALLLYLVGRAGWDKLPINIPIAHSPVMLVVTVVNLVLILIAFLWKPTGLGWEFGAFVSLFAAAVAVAPTAIPALQSRTGSG
jgi:hypothetical protein